MYFIPFSPTLNAYTFGFDDFWRKDNMRIFEKARFYDIGALNNARKKACRRASLF